MAKPSSYCGKKWFVTGKPEIIHVCLLAPDHEDKPHYCGIWHLIDTDKQFKDKGTYYYGK